MASRILHLAVAQEIINRIQINDKNRFRLGLILPDAYNAEVSKADSHLKISVCGNSKKMYDLDKFIFEFIDEMRSDDLYLGYYLHLIQDMIFRKLVYGKYKWNPMIPGNVQRLHNDYHLINQYVINKYSISNVLSMIEDLTDEKIYSIYPFDVVSLLEDLKQDFYDESEEDIFFFTENMADDFIQSAADICVKEIVAIKNGKSNIDAYEYAWKSERKSLLKTTQNTRDLGGYRTSNGQMTKLHSLIRSDVQNYPCEEDFEYLKKYNITTVIDMRGSKDVERKPSGFARKEGFDYYSFQIDEGSGVPESMEAVPLSYMKIACSEAMLDVIRCIANANGGVMFNCTAGKDRTGVVSAILLCHVGVSDEDIIENYVLTREYGKERLELLHKNFPEVDMNIVTPNEKFMEEFLRLFRDRFGNTNNYFIEIGLSLEEIDRITRKLIERNI